MQVIRRARAAAAILVLLTAACSGDSTTGPGDEPTVEQTVDITNVFANGSAPGVAANGMSFGSLSSVIATVDIRKIRLTVYRDPGTTVLFQATYDVDPAQNGWTLPFTAPIGATVRIVAELMSVTGGVPKVEYSGQTPPVVITACTTDCDPIPVPVYPGTVENLGATSVTVTPAELSLAVGESETLTAAALPASSSYEYVWSSLDAAVASVTPEGGVTAVAPGTARIVVRVGPRSDTSLVTVTGSVDGNCVVRPYALGSTVNGAWADGDCLAASGSGRRYDMYEFTIAQQTAFRAQITGPNGRRVSMRRSGTEEYVQLMGGEAFMPPTSNPLEVRYVLAPGSYTFEIANPDAATLGGYTLATSMDATASCSPLVFVTLGVTINESLSASDCDGIFGGKEDWFLLLPNAGQRVDLKLETTQIAPILVFRDDRQGPASPTLASDFRFQVGETARAAHTTTFAGFHEIVVNNATAALGSYKLTIGSGNPANTCVASPTSVGSRRLAMWESTDCTAGTDIFDRYPLTLTAQAAFRTVLATDAPVRLTGVFKGDAEVLEWIKSTPGDVNAYWFLAPGSYDVVSKAPATSAGAAYTLAVEATNGEIGCANNATTGNYTFANQTLGGSDCSFDGSYEDRVLVLAQAGQQIVATMNGTFPPNVVIRDPASPPGTVLIMTPRDTPGITASTWTAAATGYYQVIFRSSAPGGTGSYSASIAVN